MQLSYFNKPPHPVTITIIGCGGTGSALLQSLARINSALLATGHKGIHVTAYDGDIIGRGNIGRQLFSECDLGLNKAVALVQNINRFYGFYWQGLPYNFHPEAHPSNIIISCVDDWNTRKQIDHWYKMISYQNYSDRYRPYLWMDLGNGKDFGQMVVSAIFKEKHDLIKLPSVVDLYPDTVNDIDTPSCSLEEALLKQDLFINQFMANTTAEILYRFLKSATLETVGFYLNLSTFKINTIAYEQRKNNAVIKRSSRAA